MSRTSWLELSRRELRTLLIAAAVILAALALVRGAGRLLGRGRFRVDGAVETVGSPLRLDVNTARAYELQLLPGIGPKTAEAIVEDRRLRGPYGRLEDLTRVDGIGQKTVEGLRPRVMCLPPQQGD